MKKTMIVSVLLALGCAACNGCSGKNTSVDSTSTNEGGSAGVSGSAGSAGSGPDEDYLTRGEFAIMLVKNLLGIQSIGPNVCPSKWDDVANDTELCFAVKMLTDADVEIAYSENDKKLVKPGDTLAWQDAWQLTAQTAGWIPYPDKCLSEVGIGITDANAWYAGALCSRGLLPKLTVNLQVKTAEGNKFMQDVKSFQGKNATRFDTIELMANRLLGFKYDNNAVCTPSFPDLMVEMKLRCQLTQFMVNEGLLQGYPDGQLRGENLVNTAEYMKLLALSAKLDTPSCKTDACAGTAEMGAWYCNSAQAVCKTGVVDSIVPADLITRDFLTVTAIEMKKYLAKLSPKDTPPEVFDRGGFAVPSYIFDKRQFVLYIRTSYLTFAK